MAEKTPIPIDQCRHGGLYRIGARNFSIGVYNKESRGFIGVREKFGSYYLFTEYHWDTGEPFGTATPYEFLEMVPDGIDIREDDPSAENERSPNGLRVYRQNNDLFEYIDGMWDKYVRGYQEPEQFDIYS